MIEILSSAAFWKALGIIAGVIGAVVAVIRNHAATNLNLLHEKFKSFVKEKVSKMEQIASNNRNEVEMMMATGLSELNEIKSDIKDMIQTYNIQISRQLETQSQTMADMTESLEDIQTNIGNINSEIHEMKMAEKNKQEFKSKLLEVMRDALSYYGEDDMCIRSFASHKANKFIDFAMEIRSLDFNKVSFDVISNKGNDISEEIKREGYEILGKAFTDLFYDKHIMAAQMYFLEIEEYLRDEMNRTKYHFQLASEQFMNKFLRILYRCYMENKHLIKINQLEDMS